MNLHAARAREDMASQSPTGFGHANGPPLSKAELRSAKLLAKKGVFVFAQINPFFAGKYDRPSEKRGNPNWKTAKRLAEKIRDTPISVIGFQEIRTKGDAHKLVKCLNDEKTGRPWRFRHFGTKASAHFQKAQGVAICWRSDIVKKHRSLGVKRVQTIRNDWYHKKPHGHVTQEEIDANKKLKKVIFGGMMFATTHAKRRFAVFTGKLTWIRWDPEHVVLDRKGHEVTDEYHRVREIRVLKRWIKAKLKHYPKAGRVVTMDMNADHGSPPYTEMTARGAAKYKYGGTRKWTFPAPWLPPAPPSVVSEAEKVHYDFIYYRCAKKVRGPRVTSNFGSDHFGVVTTLQFSPKTTKRVP
jgi:hypothetical protein